MRVISGSAGRRKLKQPSGSKIRPTGGKVKESIFNIIQFDIEGRVVLDLFAGTGQMGIETLSRGAKTVDFVDIDTEAIRLIRENVRLCDFDKSANIYQQDAISFLSNVKKYDVIFIDPPYNLNLENKVFPIIEKFDKLNENGIIIFETEANKVSPQLSPPYVLKKEYNYGGVKIVRYSKEVQGAFSLI